jgi:dienelactone hydrolase
VFWRQDIDAQPGAPKVLLKRGELVDESRGNRAVPYKIYYPEIEGTEKMPVVLWSHGFGGNRDGAGFLSRYIASHRYIVVHMTHYGTDSSLWEGQRDKHPWDVLRNTSVTRETTVDRFLDVPFILDRLEAWAAQGDEIAVRMDFSRIGISGHSFGALTTQVLAGQMFPNDKLMLASFRDERFKAGIAYSPVPTRSLTGEDPEKYIYGPIAIPIFYMTGTADESPLKGFDYNRRLVVYEHTGTPEKYLLIKEGGDHMVYNGTRGKLGENPLRGRHEEIIKIASLAFWETYLREDKTAKDWLVKGGFAAYLGTDGQYRIPQS